MTVGSLKVVVTALCSVALLALAAFVAPSAFAEDEKELGWSGSVAAGIALTEGTTDTFGGNANAKAQYDWEKDLLSLEIAGLFTESDSDTTANNQRALGEYRHYFTDRFFGFNTHGVSRDTIQLIKFRYETVAGPGYRWWEANPKNRYFDTRAGLGYLHQQFLASDDYETEATRDDLTANFGFEHANVIGDSLEILHTAGIVIPVESADQFIVSTELTASVPIALGWAFRNTFGLEYQNKPAPDADNTNIQYTAGLEYSF